MNRGVLPILLVAAVTAIALAARAQMNGAPQAPGVWVAHGTGVCQFTLQNYPLSAESGQEINRIVTDLLHRHEQAFGFTASDNFHVRIRIFGRQQDFVAYAATNRSVAGLAEGANSSGTAMTTGINAASLAGYYSIGNREVVTWRQRDPGYLANNILHECSHAIMYEQYPYLPLWLAEGCAVYFSFPLELQDADDVRTLRLRWETLDYWLGHDQLPKLKSFLNLSEGEFRSMDATVAYTTSWSVFQFLMSSPENRKVLNRLVDIVKDSDHDPADCASVLNGVYPGGLTQFERNWHAWIKRGAAAVEPVPKS